MKFDFFGVVIDSDTCVRPPLKRKPYFTIGDAIVYPGAGIGVIQGVRNINGIEFFVIGLIKGQSKILVPMNRMIHNGAVLLE